MPNLDRRAPKSCRVVLTLTLLWSLAIVPNAVSQDKAAPPWGEFLRQGRWPGFDRLLRRPFRMSPEEEVKGLAAKLRARELDVPNRKRAVNYLKTFHCAKFPEARDMLIDVLVNDKWEPVRYEAAMGLRDMFANCACGEQDEKSDREIRQDRLRGAPDAGSPKHCACCCDTDTLNKIAKVAYEIKENGCCLEPSRRVREMAIEAINACGVPCHYQPYKAIEEQGPPAWEAGQNQEKIDGGGGELIPPPTNELTPALPMTQSSPTPISRLTKVCLVSLKQGQRLTPSNRFSTSHRGRIYYFASQAALEEFKRSPEDYSVAFGGCDPVHFVNTHEVLEGRFLVTHDGTYYMFATKQNYERFKADVVRYTGKKTNKTKLASTTELASTEQGR
ncbi:MAG: hypothetical protein ABGZ53_20465 [Fuerstiella sp.]